MKKILITNGVIAGAIVSLMFLITHPLYEKGIVNYDNGEIIGYSTMVIALSMIFFGIKTYRDQHLNGSIKFLQGMKIGLLITLIAGVMYALSWEIYYNTFASDYLAQYTQHYINKMKASGASEVEITTMKAEMDKFAELYDSNPFIRFGMTLMEIFPVGLIISLISAALLRRRQILPA
jgi:hypothetical protein